MAKSSAERFNIFCDAPEESILPAFWTDADESDAAILREQLRGRKFDGRIVRAIAKRCSKGRPQVAVCEPIKPDGAPFPTLFWLTCPFLDKKCGALEAKRLIAELEKEFAATPEAVKKMHDEYAKLRAALLSREERAAITAKNPAIARAILNSGVGGTNAEIAPFAVKCLHLHTATWLGMGRHPAERLLAELLGRLECE